jgi:ubiquinone/menaquinone biosynthesis C-methylase UbiE
MTHYDVIGDVYGSQRRTDPRIAAVLWDALGGAKAVLNVGAGTGSYEPPDAQVIALDRSHSMLQHHEGLTTPLIQGSAEALPLNNGSVDAVMAVLTIHHWVDQKRGTGAGGHPNVGSRLGRLLACARLLPGVVGIGPPDLPAAQCIDVVAE